MQDILVNTDYDLNIVNGDFQISESSDQNIEFIFKTNPGDFKEHITTGIAIQKSKNSNIDRFLDRTIRVQMKADGFKISQLEITETGVTIDGNYE